MDSLKPEYYDLDGNPMTMEEWAVMFESRTRARRAAVNGESSPDDDPTRIGSDRVGNAWVSTVWLGLDHGWGDGPPIIFETLVFGGPLEDEGDRYSTKEQALAGHKAMVERVREAQRATYG